MDLREIQRIQKEFDMEYFPGFWNINGAREFIESLKHVSIALAGEVGEFCNIVKKIDRIYMNLGGEPDEDMLNALRDEVADIFIYVLIAANLLNMDLEDCFIERLKYNRERFKGFRDG